MERPVQPSAEPSSGEPGSYRPQARADEKQRAREADERALAAGGMSPEELGRERGAFVFPHVRVDLDGVLSFE
jgi:hypothetical protein